MVALTFSSVTKETLAIFPYFTYDDINFLLLWSAVTPMVFMFPAAFICARPDGLRSVIQYGAILVTLGCVLRNIPFWLGPEFYLHHSTLVRILMNAGQMFNGLAFPLFMVAPTRLSMEWFEESQRTTITAIAAVSCEVGFAASFFIPHFTDNVEEILSQSVTLSIGALFAAMSLSCMPARPADPPSLGTVLIALVTLVALPIISRITLIRCCVYGVSER